MMSNPTPRKTPLHILHILDHSLPLHSGYTFRSQSIFRAQAKRNWQLTILTSPKHQESWKGKWELQEKIGGFPYFRTPLAAQPSVRGLYEARLIWALYQRIRNVASTCKPDVIHAHSPLLNAIAALRAAKQRHIPLVYEIRAFWEDAAVDHGSYRENSLQYRIVRALETWICRKANHVTVICDGLRRDLVQRGIPESKISIVPNGIEIEEFKDCPPDREFMADWNLSGKNVIGFLGSFYRYEGLDLAIEAFQSLASQYKNWILLLVGGGEMDAPLKEKASMLGLTDRIIFPGRISHERIPGIYSLADILIYPRHSMRLTDLVTPLKPLEAMAMGKAVIASDVGGHRELISDGETGILFPAGNAATLASSIEKLLNNKESRQAMAQRGQDWVRKERSWEKTTAIYGDIYEKLLTGSSGMNH
jgi:PEP-CTERM/exosortase A-associated glycosyltransferase